MFQYMIFIVAKMKTLSSKKIIFTINFGWMNIHPHVGQRIEADDFFNLCSDIEKMNVGENRSMIFEVNRYYKNAFTLNLIYSFFLNLTN